MEETNNTFADKIKSNSGIKREKIEEEIAHRVQVRQEEREKHEISVRNELFHKLTNKYHPTITHCIVNASNKGNREKFINFDRNDFKANCHGLGYPQQVMENWLKEMCSPDSIYLPVCTNYISTNYNNWWKEGDKMHFEGIQFEVWNNKAFTTKFSW
mgnify:CR=1 FL=1|tara:strand:+ start:966 stop:1436 length:471 start_codon:yes stop_codon:yes gene_type:complete